MSYDIDSNVSVRSLPPLAPVYRRKGILASLLSAVAAFLANLRLRRASRRYRSGKAPPVPEWLREDIGLEPLPPRLPDWWQFIHK